ncbi:hypothetical protein [Marivivens aquimaris]|uniref:hypothetical protein n=1 Tax=Marivivens aquimaris TaxID=2774876 RepID=UPI001882087E|nr:hypothetical protein [Marivivens aquimaris]
MHIHMPARMMRLPNISGDLALALLLTLPFCAMAKPGWLGNFDANLSLFVLVPLLPVLWFTRTWRVVLVRGRGGVMLRAVVGLLLICAVFTVIGGVRLHFEGVTAYGLDPLPKSLKTAIVPLLLAVFVTAAAAVPSLARPADLQSAMVAGFALVAAYTAIQWVSLVAPNAIYSMLWPAIEGARDNGGVSAITRFGRVTGPTMEPAELAKLAILFFLPWFAFPAEGRANIWLLLGALTLAALSMSIIGLLLVGMSAVLLIRHFRWLAIVVIAAAVSASLLPGLTERLANISHDPSAIIRSHYNAAALGLIAERPIFGLGWSNELFFYPERVSGISHLWEVSEDLRTGNALTAKSLMLRLAMYAGLPVLIGTISTITWALIGGRSRALSRARFALAIFAIAGAIDGGMITSLYLWAGPSLCIGALIAERRAL